MKHLSSGVAIAAVLVFAASAWAQSPNPSGGNPMGMPGPSPGGPGLTPYSTGTSPPAATSAMPPKHRHARSSKHHGKTAAKSHRGPQLTGSSANQLNQEELARLQAGNFSNPSAPPAPPSASSAPPGAEVRGRGFGPKVSGSGYIPPPPSR
jgi:hypothetical protein